MLYVSTRNKMDSFTAYRVLHEDKAPDGGYFAPFHLPVFSAEEIQSLKDKTFSETVANILNLFFSRHLTSWDVEFSVGRSPFRMENIGQKVTVAELWHNSVSNYNYLVANLYKKLSDKGSSIIPKWVYIGVEIAILFGLYGELLRSDIQYTDIALTDNVLHYPIAAWYARKMGLPIGMIICGCGENTGMWDFVRRGEASDAVGSEVELLIYESLGLSKVDQFTASRAEGRTYRLNAEATDILSHGIYACVIGDGRISAITANIQRTCGYSADPMTSAAFGALQDYRAATGENRHTLLLSRYRVKE